MKSYLRLATALLVSIPTTVAALDVYTGPVALTRTPNGVDLTLPLAHADCVTAIHDPDRLVSMIKAQMGDTSAEGTYLRSLGDVTVPALVFGNGVALPLPDTLDTAERLCQRLPPDGQVGVHLREQITLRLVKSANR